MVSLCVLSGFQGAGDSSHRHFIPHRVLLLHQLCESGDARDALARLVRFPSRGTNDSDLCRWCWAQTDASFPLPAEQVEHVRAEGGKVRTVARQMRHLFLWLKWLQMQRRRKFSALWKYKNRKSSASCDMFSACSWWSESPKNIVLFLVLSPADDQCGDPRDSFFWTPATLHRRKHDVLQ